jgi:hypothetical protein
MTAVGRVTMLHLRTVAPYRTQGLLFYGLLVAILARNPVGLVPVLALMLTPVIAAYPFVIADKAGLETLYAVLPLSRRAVVLGHYTWALASFVGTVVAGAVPAVILMRTEDGHLDGRTLMTLLTVSWALFALNISVQLPLLMRFGYARSSALGTNIPVALIMLAVYRLHLTIASVQVWLPLLWAGGAAVLVASATLAARPAGQQA